MATKWKITTKTSIMFFMPVFVPIRNGINVQCININEKKNIFYLFKVAKPFSLSRWRWRVMLFLLTHLKITMIMRSQMRSTYTTHYSTTCNHSWKKKSKDVKLHSHFIGSGISCQFWQFQFKNTKGLGTIYNIWLKRRYCNAILYTLVNVKIG